MLSRVAGSHASCRGAFPLFKGGSPALCWWFRLPTCRASWAASMSTTRTTSSSWASGRRSQIWCRSSPAPAQSSQVSFTQACGLLLRTAYSQLQQRTQTLGAALCTRCCKRQPGLDVLVFQQLTRVRSSTPRPVCAAAGAFRLQEGARLRRRLQASPEPAALKCHLRPIVSVTSMCPCALARI
jgi:hypothetical protein